MARYSKASDDDNYFRENQDVKEIFDVAHNLRFGAEYRLNIISILERRICTIR